MRQAFRAGWRTKGLLRPVKDGRLCEACHDSQPRLGGVRFWSDDLGRDVWFCDEHASAFKLATVNRAGERAWRAGHHKGQG